MSHLSDIIFSEVSVLADNDICFMNLIKLFPNFLLQQFFY